MFTNFLSKIKSSTVSLLKFMRLVGDDGHWDWTTASLVVTLSVLSFKVTNPGPAELAALALTLLARGHKKQISAKHATEQDKTNAELASQLQVTMTKLGQISGELERVKTEVGLANFNPNAFGGFAGVR